MTAEPNATPTPGATSAPGPDVPVLEARGVSKYFGTVVALKDVSLSVRPGEVNCLLGDNGAGKSTLIKILSGVYRPDEGSLYMGGQAIQREFDSAGVGTVVDVTAWGRSAKDLPDAIVIIRDGRITDVGSRMAVSIVRARL